MSRYYQYNKWHQYYRINILFDHQTNKLEGNGSDHIGDYTLDGIYSTKTNRIGLTKTYVEGTGNFQENLGHTVTIQISWNSIQHQFEGKWFIQTNNCFNQDKFQLKIEKREKYSQ